MSEIEWKTLLQTMLGPDTWVRIDISGPFKQDEYDMLNEHLKLMVRRVERKAQAGEAREGTR